jgi:alpha-tubulin suppressor-like RCC1 family protein
VAVATGGAHSLVLRSDGRIEASGHNVYGQLGNPAAGYLSERGVEVTVTAGMRPIVAIAAGEGFSVALDESGVVWTWGHNSSGQLGHGTTIGTQVPQRVVGIDPVQLIAAGQDHVLAVARDGQLWSWGSNRNGKLGQGNVGPVLAQPGRVLLSGQVVAIAAGAEHSVSLHFDGTVFTWGINETGQLGNGSGSPGFRHTPGFVSLLPGGIRAIAAGNGLGHSLALGADGRVWAWGHNHRGQLGDGTLESRPTPVAVPSLNLN